MYWYNLSLFHISFYFVDDDVHLFLSKVFTLNHSSHPVKETGKAVEIENIFLQKSEFLKIC